jgi:hypothetical protein
LPGSLRYTPLGVNASQNFVLFYQNRIIGLSVEARVNHVIQDRDATKLPVDFGHDETALIELWQVLEV